MCVHCGKADCKREKGEKVRVKDNVNKCYNLTYSFYFSGITLHIRNDLKHSRNLDCVVSCSS